MDVLMILLVGVGMGIIVKTVAADKFESGYPLIMLLGAIGAFVGGFIRAYLRIGEMLTGLLWALVFAAIGAVAILVIFRRITQRG